MCRSTDPEADREEDDDEALRRILIDYSAERREMTEDADMDSEEDEDADMDIDEEDEDDEMEDEDAEEEHSAPAYPVVVALPATAPSAEETEPFETDESAATPLHSPCISITLSPWSSSPPLDSCPLSPPSPVCQHHPSPIISLGYRATSWRFLGQIGFVYCHYGWRLDVTLRWSMDRDYRCWDEGSWRLYRGAPVSHDTELGATIAEFELLLDEIQMRFTRVMETEAWIWQRSPRYTSADEETEAMSDLLETDRRRREEMRELRAADRTRQQQIIQTLTAVQTLQRETIPLRDSHHPEGAVTALQGQLMTLGQVMLQGQQDHWVPALPGLPEDAGRVLRLDFVMASRFVFSLLSVTGEIPASNGTENLLRGTGVRGSERVARECTYQDFMKCKPLYFKGTEGVVELTQWFERRRLVFSEYATARRKQIKFVLKADDKYCHVMKWKKLDAEMWELEGNRRIKIGKSQYLGGKPLKQKESLKNFPTNQNQQQQPNKRQNTGRAYTAGSGDKKPYGGSRPLCPKCNYHHDGPCAPKCYKCNKYGHIARDCRGTGNANNNNQKGTGSGQKPTCFECGVQGHFQKDCPRLKNNKGNRGNQAGNNRAPAKVYVVGNAGANPDNVVAEVLRKGFSYLSGTSYYKEMMTSRRRSDFEDVPPFKDFPDVAMGTRSTGAFGVKGKLSEQLKELSTRFKAQFSHWGARIHQLRVREEDIPKRLPSRIQQARARKASEDNIGIAEERGVIESIKDWASPKSPTEIRQFLGLAGYYRRFIEGFSKIAKPMTKLTQKKIKFEWGDKQEAAFQLLKQKLCSAPILALPEGSEDFIAYCDASKKGLVWAHVLMPKRKSDFLCITTVEDS
ncbi:putative reverse transcriptase domain-containing protein [Tanacetum coccineum]